MKDYTTNKDDKKSFITNFKVIGKKIIVFYADGRKELKNNTDEEIKNLIRILESQVKQTQDFENSTFNKIVVLSKVLMSGILFTTLITIILMNKDMFGYAIILDLISGGALSLTGLKIKSNTAALNDIKKYKIFIEKRSEILENIKRNPNVLMDTTTKTQGIIKHALAKRTIPEEYKFNISDIDEIPLDDLYKILNNTEEPESDIQTDEAPEKSHTIKPIGKQKH